MALAEPVGLQMAESRQEFDLPDERCYPTHRELLDGVTDLDGAIVATNVATHREVACACMERGVAAFLDLLDDPTRTGRATIRDGFETVLQACAADLSRRETRVIELSPIRDRLDAQAMKEPDVEK